MSAENMRWGTTLPLQQESDGTEFVSDGGGGGWRGGGDRWRKGEGWRRPLEGGGDRWREVEGTSRGRGRILSKTLPNSSSEM